MSYPHLAEVCTRPIRWELIAQQYDQLVSTPLVRSLSGKAEAAGRGRWHGAGRRAGDQGARRPIRARVVSWDERGGWAPPAGRRSPPRTGGLPEGAGGPHPPELQQVVG